MTLDNHDLQRLVGLYRQVATANAEIAAVYADQLQRAKTPANTYNYNHEPVRAPVADAKAEPALVEVQKPVAVSVETVPADDPAKPPAQRVAVAGFDISKMGFAAGSSSLPWETLIAYPPFHMFVDEQKFPNPEGKDAMELAVDFIMEQSKTKAELQFYAEYAKWFKDKGFWPNETPLGKPLPQGKE